MSVRVGHAAREAFRRAARLCSQRVANLPSGQRRAAYLRCMKEQLGKR